MCSFQRNRTFKILYRFKDFIIYSGFISRYFGSQRCIDIQFTVFFAPTMSGTCILKTVIIPIGNRNVVRGQNQVAAHFCCFWKIQCAVSTAKINVISHNVCPIVIYLTAFFDGCIQIIANPKTSAIFLSFVIGYDCSICYKQLIIFILERIPSNINTAAITSSDIINNRAAIDF